MSLLLAVMASNNKRPSSHRMPACQMRLPQDMCLSTLTIGASLWGVYYTRGNSPCLPHSTLASSINRASTIITLPPWKAPQVCDQLTGVIDPARSLSLCSPQAWGALLTSSLSPGSRVLSIC